MTPRYKFTTETIVRITMAREFRNGWTLHMQEEHSLSTDRAGRVRRDIRHRIVVRDWRGNFKWHLWAADEKWLLACINSLGTHKDLKSYLAASFRDEFMKHDREYTKKHPMPKKWQDAFRLEKAS